MKHITLLTTIVLLALLNVTGTAHHSIAATYRLDQTEVMEGTVVMVAFNQPHTYMHLEATERNGVVRRWSLQWADAADLFRHGVTRSTVRAGDRLQVTGHPGRNPETYQMLIVAMTRPADGWTWGEDWQD